jgi:hypothetical protein
VYFLSVHIPLVPVGASTTVFPVTNTCFITQNPIQVTKEYQHQQHNLTTTNDPENAIFSDVHSQRRVSSTCSRRRSVLVFEKLKPALQSCVTTI